MATTVKAFYFMLFFSLFWLLCGLVHNFCLCLVFTIGTLFVLYIEIARLDPVNQILIVQSIKLREDTILVFHCLKIFEVFRMDEMEKRIKSLPDYRENRAVYDIRMYAHRIRFMMVKRKGVPLKGLESIELFRKFVFWIIGGTGSQATGYGLTKSNLVLRDDGKRCTLEFNNKIIISNDTMDLSEYKDRYDFVTRERN